MQLADLPRTLLTALTAERQPVATVYHRLGWPRRQLEQVMQAHRVSLEQAGVHFHVATHNEASGRKEHYIELDGTRIGAISRGEPDR